jgi:DNA repair protein RecO (recombination protein O)
MNRNQCIQGLILSVKPMGEDNRLATILSPEKGVFTALVYGGRKGKLRSLISPYHSGKLWLYCDESKKSIKVSDFDVTEYRTGIRENLYKSCGAALCAELVIKTQSGIDNDKTWILTKGYLDGLHLASEIECKLGTLRFLWRFLDLMGLQADTEFCGFCGNPLLSNSGTSPSNMILWYSITDNTFLCSDCIHSGENSTLFKIHHQGLHYLHNINTASPAEVRRLTLSAETVQELHELLFYLISRFSETRLKSLEAGIGIL